MVRNKLILGTVQFGLNYGISNTKGKVSLNDSLEILGYAYDNGIRTLDSAEAYGNAHEIIGIFHDKNPAKIFNIITKLPKVINYDIIDRVNGYLKDLKVDHLETLMFHSFDSYHDNLNNFDSLRKLKSNRRIKNLGVSVYTNNEIEQVISNKDIDVIQLPFNLFDNANFRGDILQKAKIKGKIIHTRSALLQGLFFKEKNASDEIVQKLKNELTFLSSISKREGMSISEMALSYCMQQKTIDNVLVGVDSINQLIDNLGAINYKIKQKTIDSINSINVKDLDLLNPSLWNK